MWVAFFLLQAADIYSTHRGMQWDCVYERNPLLPRVPTVPEMLVHKAIVLTPLIEIDRNVRRFTWQELFPATAITAWVVVNNINVEKRAKKNCSRR